MEFSVIRSDEWFERARSLEAEGWGFMDLTAVDRLSLLQDAEGNGDAPRFEVVVQLLNKGSKERKMLHVAAEGDPPTVPSVVDVWPAANFFEREVFDLLGVRFDGHPNLERIMMPDGWEGHPLRKDYGVGKVTVEYLPQPLLQIDSPGQGTTTHDAGEPVDRLGQAGQPERRRR